MESRDFVEFMKVGDQMLAVQFSIETKRFDSFRKPFITNKWLTVKNWEELMNLLHRALSEQLKLGEAEQMKAKGEFTVDESLLVTYKTKPKEECFIDFNKLDFPDELGWMLAVSVSRAGSHNINEQPSGSQRESSNSQKTPLEESLSQSTSNGSTTVSLSSELEYDQSPRMKEIMSRYPPSKTEEPKRRVLGSPEHCSRGNNSQASSSKIDRKDDENVNFESVIKNTKVSGKSNTELFGVSSGSSKANLNKNSGAVAKSKKPKPTKEKKKPVDVFDQEHLDKMEEFVAASKIKFEQREERKQQLKDFRIRHCTDMTNDELASSIKRFRREILKIFETRSRDQRLDYVLLTTGNILTESQTLFALKQIEELRPEKERGTEEDLLMQVVLPEVILHLFGKKYRLEKRDALDVLSVQEEYKMLWLAYETM